MNILVGISGGIAAYKSPDLVRRLREHGADVRVVMTEAATSFIGELSLQAVSGHRVHRHMMDPEAEAAMGHIELARWADKILIAPASANCMAQLAHGFANDLLTTVALASQAPLFIAPAMNQQMWANIATQENLQTLINRGVEVIGPGVGDQACGEVGAGRMEEPAMIAEQIMTSTSDQSLQDKHIMITAGPTQEAIDPVRYVTNHSSGKMGFALAAAAVRAGAKVTLISGPVTIQTPLGVERINVTSATDMHNQVMQNLDTVDVFIGCAAVADYGITEPASQKLKKTDDQLVLTMVKNPDIIGTVANQANKPYCVGFAAETNDVEAFGRKKLQAKQLDMICINDVSDQSIGFNSDDNELTVVSASSDDSQTITKSSKSLIAKKLLQLIAEQLN
ncbi:MAG: bifunctional phosphopantothenoylcysteine decarboxylase/phosphopantothenate--cysteine ligase CoaBC [Gammaproteobacteria bacterium]